MRTFKSKVQKFSDKDTSLGKVLEMMTKMSSELLEAAAQKGAVWLQKGNGKTLRVRSLSSLVKPQDTISFFYDARILSLPTLTEAQCIDDNLNYGVWYKPAGIVAQGTQVSDHTSLLRYIEIKKNKEPYLIHRLDRETAGLMIFGYTKEAAGKLSDLFSKNLVHKTYVAIVSGSMEKGVAGTINASLDDKEAITHYRVLESNTAHSKLEVIIETGRLHQIRRHLDHIGHPVMGDPKYGKGNKNKSGLMLVSTSLKFIDPWSRKEVSWKREADISLTPAMKNS